ncbi:hypothetical protein [Negadavirga shengliensis]|uniref:Uncharacterized protein n=1 Tax=Negadavirga shengliensis TaxID=1389218 RepID=A0ABV9T1I6_9BACT
MEPRRALTLMVFPQRFDGEKLIFNIVVIPRNADPFVPFPTGKPDPADVPGFASLQPEFQIGVVSGLDDFPLSNATAPGRIPKIQSITVSAVPQKSDTIEAVAKSFSPIPISDTNDKIPAPLPLNKSVKKYLPFSYRNSFNFTQPRHENAVTDDSYECALRDKVEPILNYVPKDSLSWGKVFAHILRQPLLAKACGMIYEAEVEVEEDWFEEGGYLYVDITNDPWKDAQELLLEDNDGPLIKRYAARIPKLEPGVARPVFSAVLFPVLYQKNGQPEVVPPAPWDELFKESLAYSDGFAKIVHANQPVSGNLLKEHQDGLHPQKDAGIRLAWDDEQILIWYIRQLTENPEAPGSGERIDAPLGVIGYKIDVREQVPDAEWESLHQVTVNQGASDLGKMFPPQPVELSHQVYPTKVNTLMGSNYWLPMYFANWIGKNLAVGDDDALEIYKNDQDNSADIDGTTPRKATVNKALEPVPINTELRYGKTYQFRVRMSDISGGGPDVKDDPIHSGPSPQTTVSFRRYIAPDKLIISKPDSLLNSKAEYYNSVNGEENEFLVNPVVRIKRPLLEYPAVVFTDKYQQAGMDPIAMLKALSFDSHKQLTLGLPDPDVNKVEVRVEVRTLEMDNSLSQDGRENYITLYTTHRSFPADFDGELEIPVQFIDVPVLNLGVPVNPFLVDNLKKEDLDDMEEIVLPTGRHVRVSFRAVAGSGEVNEHSYFGVINESQPESDSRYGKVQQLMFYRETQDESELLRPFGAIPVLQGLFLKPNEVPLIKGNNIFKTLFLPKTTEGNPDIVKRLADALGLKAKGLTLVAPKGERVIFGISSRIRHSLAPDGCSVTFANRAELQDHWLGCISYQLNRDWTWDSLQDVAFAIDRKTKFRRDEDAEASIIENLGDIEFKHTVSFEALQPDRFGNINRSYTRIVYIDAIEPKSGLPRSQSDPNPRFPDEIWVDYTLKPSFKEHHATHPDVDLDQIKLPTVLPPSQIPKIASVGIAFSPYERSEDYSSTEARKRYLWVEFEEPVENQDDTYFCRVLANAPDQLLSNNKFDQLVAPEEPSIALDPEFTRIIVPGQSDDMAGLGAMQPMLKASDSDKHYILPLPPGLHAESPELFGFFTYEFRLGHGQWPDREDNLWSTAQGRFGRPLRVTGIQHPAPTLLCSLNRDENHLYVSAPFAKAVHKGKNVTAKPPRTSLWALLYAQVTQADGRDYRNILIGEKEMRFDFKVNESDEKAKERKLVTAMTFSPAPQPEHVAGSFQLIPEKMKWGGLVALMKDIHPVGTAAFESQEIADQLVRFGLPEDSPLSVLVVEVFGNITNLRDHMPEFGVAGAAMMDRRTFDEARSSAVDTNPHDIIRPLSTALGHFRILRTSPLTKVPFVCCPTCEK